MNICSFTGYLVEDPYVSFVDGVALAEFTLVTYTYRRTKSTGEKNRIPTYIKCEAWHTGAETLEKFAGKGTKLTINTSASKDSFGIKKESTDQCALSVIHTATGHKA